jgi:hypothetical protein
VTAAAGKLSEAQIQKLIRSYLAALAIDSVHFANGAVLAGDAKARSIQMNKLKAAGMVPGASDLILFDRRARRVGFLEVKRPGQNQSDKQREFERLATGVWGWPYAVVRSQEDAAGALHQWGWR